MAEEVVELRLCEQDHLILKPNQLYLFTVAPDCEQCQSLAAIHSAPRAGGEKG